MTSVCYMIVCVNLLCSFDYGESFPHLKTQMKQLYKLHLLISSLTVENQYEYLAKIISPYYNLTYSEQLDKKQNSCIVVVEDMVRRSHNLKNLMTYKLLKIVPSPVTKFYRNKDEFYISPGVDGNPKTVGFTLGSVALGKVFSIHPTKIDFVKKSHKKVAQVYEDFIRISPLPASIKHHDGGHWHRLLVRSNQVGDIMACVSVKPKGTPYSMIQNQQQALKEYFFKHLPNIALFHQVCQRKRCSSDFSPFNLLYGERYLMETFYGYLFKISPDTVFPVNIYGAEGVYDTIIKTAKLTKKTIVLDICCGSGFNSITLSRFVRNVIGFDSIPIVDAKYLAHFNDIHNLRFLVGNIHNNLNSILTGLNASDVVAIVSHRSTGAGLDITRLLRNYIQIRTIFYTFYKPHDPCDVRNFAALCSNNMSMVPPFRLTKVIPFDIFPITKNVEIFLMFQREKVGNN